MTVSTETSALRTIDRCESETTTTCPCCGSERSTTAGIDQCWSPWNVLECSDCGQWHTSPRLTVDELDEHYPDDYACYQPRRAKSGALAALRKRFRGSAAQVGSAKGDEEPKRRRRDPYLLEPFGNGRLLDVGCGNGSYLAKMRDLGWETLGLDMSPAAARQASSQFGLSVVVRSLTDDGPLAGEPFDLISGRQVLEHVDDPRLVLRNLRKMLAPKTGRLLLSVPNKESLSAKLFGSDWIGWDVPRHVTHFSAATLRDLLESQGFELTEVRTLPQSGWMRHSAKRSNRAGLRNALLRRKTISRVLAAWSIHRGAGDSLFVLARPKSD